MYLEFLQQHGSYISWTSLNNVAKIFGEGVGEIEGVKSGSGDLFGRMLR